MEDIIVQDIDNEQIISGDELTEIYSILEANDEQFKCLWKKMEEVQLILTNIESSLSNNNRHFVIHESNTKEVKEACQKIVSEIEYQDQKLEIELIGVYKQINNNEQITTFIIMILSCIVGALFIQHYDLSLIIGNSPLNNSDF